jgi:hypothetical protein
MSMTWEFHPARAAYTQYAADWDRLNGELYGGHPNFDSRFIAPLLKHFASGRERLCLYRVQGVVCGALILLPLRGGRWTTFRPAQAQVTPILVADVKVLTTLLEALPGFAWSIEFYAVDPSYAPVFSGARITTIISPQTNCTVQNIQLLRSEGAIVVYTLLKALRRGLAGAGTSQRTDGLTPEVEVHACTSLEDFVANDYPLDGFAPRDSIEDSIDWFGLLQKQVYPCNPNIRYYFVADHGRPTAIMPLRQTTRRGVRTLESLSNYYTSLYTPLLGNDCDQPALRHLVSAVTRENRSAHVMRFAPMDPESAAYVTLLNELRATGWIPLTFFCFGNWFLRVEGGWDDYLRKRSANLRSTIKRMNKKFATDGGTLEVVSDSGALEPAIAAFQEVYSASWKQPEPYPEFVPSLIRLLADTGMLRLGIARLLDRPIAAQLWIAGQGKASIFKVAYHEAFSNYSPGTVLTSFLMQHVIEQDHIKEVDFLIGDDKYKQIWMSDRRERRGIIAFNTRTVVGCALLFWEVAGKVVKSSGLKLGVNLSRAKSSITAIMRRWSFVRNDRAQ